MECRRCGNQLVRGTKFCPFCGEKIEGYCPECGAEVGASDLYCAHCGNDLREPQLSMDCYKRQKRSLLDYLEAGQFISKVKKQGKFRIALTVFVLFIGGCCITGLFGSEPSDGSDSHVENSEESFEGEKEQDEEKTQRKEISKEEETNVPIESDGLLETEQMMLADDSEYILPESSQRYLSAEELRGLDVSMLRLARNEIYARHGRAFQTEDLNTYFSSKLWYQGYLSEEDFNDAVFNEYEKANLDLIRLVEEEEKSNTENIGTQIKISKEQQYEVNVFLSNFAEQYFGNSVHFDIADPDINALVSFCHNYAKINTDYEYEYINLPNERWGNMTYEMYSLEQCNKVMNRFFGVIFTDDEIRAAYIETEDSFYRDSDFYFIAADGETYPRFAVANMMYTDSYGDCVVDFDIYEMEQDLYWELGGIGREYYELFSDEAQNTAGVSKVAEGKAVVCPFRYNTRDTYRLKAYYVAEQ